MMELVEAILAQVIGNVSTALILLIFYFNFLLFESYLRLIVWAILFSQALRQAKTNVVSVLKYLSDDPDVDKHGFLTCVFSKSCEIFLYHPYGDRRSSKELFLNYGIFIFSLIGAISIWTRVYSWMSFVHVFIALWIIALSLIKILDRRIFFYRYFFSDEVLVSALLILGFFTTGIFVMFYLGTESYMEGSRAAVDFSEWVQKNFINDERTREIWSEQVENSRAMISAAITGVENNYNETMWWPPVKSLVKKYYLDTKASDGVGTNTTSNDSFLASAFLFPANMTMFQFASLAFSKVDSVNLTSVQLTDWTSRGLEVSSIAVGSVAQLIFLFFTLVIAFVSLGIRAFFFLSSLFYLLCMNWDPIERFVTDLLPIQVEKRPHVVHSLRKVVEGVLFLPLKMSSVHALVTLVSFTIVNADFVYLATTLTFFISIVPIIPPYLVCLPWVVSIGLTSSFIKAIALFGVQYFAFTMVDDMLYEKSIVALNSYVSALSVVFGVYVFGFEGVIFGPLSVCAVTFAYEVSNHGIQAAQDEYGRASEDLRNFVPEGVDNDDPASTGSSFSEDEDNENDADGDAENVRARDRVKSGKAIEASAPKSPNSNIFSDAMYRVISGPLVDRVRRRLSIDITTDDSLRVTIVVDGAKRQRKVRFVMNKSWTQRELYDNLRRMLRVHAIEALTASDGTEVLSPLHIFPDETLHVRVRPKARPLLFPEGSGNSDAHLRVAAAAASRRGHSSNNPSILHNAPGRSSSPVESSSSTLSTTVSSSTAASNSDGKHASTVTVPIAALASAKKSRGRLRQRYSFPAQEEKPAPLRRRSSYCMDAVHLPQDGATGPSAATFEDVASFLSSQGSVNGEGFRAHRSGSATADLTSSRVRKMKDEGKPRAMEGKVDHSLPTSGNLMFSPLAVQNKTMSYESDEDQHRGPIVPRGKEDGTNGSQTSENTLELVDAGESTTSE